MSPADQIGAAPPPLFKFEIGARVRHVGSRSGRAMVIVERLIQDCHGGRQRLYRLRDGFPISLREPFVEVTEPELAPDERWCEGCGYDIPLVDAPGMSGGRAHVWPNEKRRSSCSHVLGEDVP